jgi:hypothetical protein
MGIEIQDLVPADYVNSWSSSVALLDPQSLMLGLAVLFGLFIFRNVVLAFLGFSLKLFLLLGVSLIVLYYIPPLDEIKQFPFLASYFSE